MSQSLFIVLPDTKRRLNRGFQDCQQPVLSFPVLNNVRLEAIQENFYELFKIKFEKIFLYKQSSADVEQAY